nr:hypothetical protein [Tanacetum cinerariifolium]
MKSSSETTVTPPLTAAAGPRLSTSAKGKQPATTSKAKSLTALSEEFWATATVQHHSIRFKMDNKKHIVNLESFREMLHIGPRLPGQPFVEHYLKKRFWPFFDFLDTVE